MAQGKTISISASLGLVHKELNQQLSKIDNLLIDSSEQLQIAEDLRDEVNRWSDFTLELLKARFDDERIPAEFNKVCRRITFLTGNPVQNLRDVRKAARDRRNVLQSIVDRRRFFQPAVEKNKPSEPGSRNPKQVFIVHGHREDLKQAVARLVASVGLEPVILAEQPNAGRTIIEKLEANAQVSFAIVLLTGDDQGNAKGQATQPRARQNVILELGYFTGLLGRPRVCAIYEHGVELPSDIVGVLYVPYDVAGAWRMKLLSEFKAVGLEFDANEAL